MGYSENSISKYGGITKAVTLYLSLSLMFWVLVITFSLQVVLVERLINDGTLIVYDAEHLYLLLNITNRILSVSMGLFIVSAILGIALWAYKRKKHEEKM